MILDGNVYLYCTHGGRVVFAGRDLALPLTESDLINGVIVGCTQIGPAIKPCTKVISVLNGLTPISSEESSKLGDDLIAITDGTPPGTVYAISLPSKGLPREAEAEADGVTLSTADRNARLHTLLANLDRVLAALLADQADRAKEIDVLPYNLRDLYFALHRSRFTEFADALRRSGCSSETFISVVSNVISGVFRAAFFNEPRISRTALRLSLRKELMPAYLGAMMQESDFSSVVRILSRVRMKPPVRNGEDRPRAWPIDDEAEVIGHAINAIPVDRLCNGLHIFAKALAGPENKTDVSQIIALRPDTGGLRLAGESSPEPQDNSADLETRQVPKILKWADGDGAKGRAVVDTYHYLFQRAISATTVEPLDGLKPSIPLSPGNPFHCSVFYWDKVFVGEIGRIVACVHLGSAAEKAVRDALEKLALASGSELRAATALPHVSMPVGATIQVTVDCPTLEFESTNSSIRLWEDHQATVFRYRAPSTVAGRVCRGQICFWLHGVIVASVEIVIFISVNQIPEIFREAMAVATAKPYRRVFPSYSHVDADVVRRLESYAELFGDEYLRDQRTLRAGQSWKEEILELIRRADVFQLFWSANAAVSSWVEKEWRAGLLERVRRPDPFFVRPVYWTKEPAPIPSELCHLHFARAAFITHDNAD